MPSYCELILWVTAESVQGSQVYLEWIGTSGSFGIGGTTLRVPLNFTIETSSSVGATEMPGFLSR